LRRCRTASWSSRRRLTVESKRSVRCSGSASGRKTRMGSPTRQATPLAMSSIQDGLDRLLHLDDRGRSPVRGTPSDRHQSPTRACAIGVHGSAALRRRPFRQAAREGRQARIHAMGKGRNRKPKRLQLPILPALQRVIDASPCGDMTFFINDLNRPFTDAGLRSWAAGVHRLRRAQSRRYDRRRRMAPLRISSSRFSAGIL